MQITSALKSRKNNDRMSVYIDGCYAFSISEEDYITLNLYEEKEMSQQDIDYIKDCVNKRSAKASGVKYLSLKLRTAREVEDKLKEQGYDIDTIDNALEELKAMGYVNDKIYVQKYVYDRSKLKPKSKKLLKLELMAKGICAELIDEVLDDWELDEDSIAERLLRKKFGKYDLNEEKVRKRVHAFLQHRGFSFEQIEAAITRVREEEQ